MKTPALVREYRRIHAMPWSFSHEKVWVRPYRLAWHRIWCASGGTCRKDTPDDRHP